MGYMMAQRSALSNGILDSRGRQALLALVTEWGSESLSVVCPYCVRCHRHGLGRLPLTGQTRVAHCGLSSVSYQLYYPFEEQSQAQYSYRIDKARGLFVTVGVALPNDDEDDESNDEGGDDDDVEGGGENQFERLGIGDAQKLKPQSSKDIWEECIQDARHRQSLFNSHCILNDLRGVASLLETYKHDPFVSWRNKNGVNCIALAAVEGHDKMIQFLHGKGGDLNNADKRGRTPLMESALWGRLRAVNFLLENGADPRANDCEGRSAYFYSRPSKKTARMREKFSHYQDGDEAEANRRIIAMKLQAFEPVIAAEEVEGSGSSNQPKRGYFITKTTHWGTQIGFYEQSIVYDVPDENKTVARLDRGRITSWTTASGEIASSSYAN
ncbi:hypothetical protein NUW58_g9964 [Xylaria curta]|uniref:Uncharacterized protein n=1 Tax=Xylaria curta TaxID=42375 RepID=A0ACC1MT70_9PEZI|nr:hypothetical protein NUW58_g9964 [Xylaria curta]